MFLKMGLVLILVLDFFIGCTTPKNGVPAKDSDVLQKIYVSKIAPDQIASKAGELEISVKGSLPSPAYTFERFDVKVKANVIEVTPLARYDPDKTVIQVLVPFDNVCTVENLEPGTYEVKVYGRRDAIVKAEGIQVKK